MYISTQYTPRYDDEKVGWAAITSRICRATLAGLDRVPSGDVSGSGCMQGLSGRAGSLKVSGDIRSLSDLC